MDRNVLAVREKKIAKVIENLEKNNMNGYYVETKKDVIEIIEKLVDKGEVVGCGGSMTLFECGVIDYLRSGRYEFLDRYKEGLSREELKKVFRQSFLADAYVSSTNALTENGELYNVDGNGNRVAAMLYGPDKVIVVCGYNKIVKNVDEAIERNKSISAPANAMRLSKNTPCAKVGYCVDCKSEERICCEYTLIKRQVVKGRIHVIIIGEDAGY